MISNKYEMLKQYLLKKNKIIVAYSGGIDSSFLLKVAANTLRKNTLAVHIKFSVYDTNEFYEMEKFAKDLNVDYKVIEINEFEIDKFSNNPIDRCYYCKKYILKKIIDYGNKNGYKHIADGSNIDDLNDFRPGEKAISELNVISPLKEVGITKLEIRNLSKEIGIKFWDKPSAACLASRFPYNTKINIDLLKMIYKAEKFIKDNGFTQVRVRYHGDIARIEILKDEFILMLKDNTMDKIDKFLKSIGFKYITLDLKGYRTGSLNEFLDK